METNGDKKPLNKAGYYKHRETGVVLWLDVTPEIGTPLIDAYIQAGFVYVGEEDPKIAEKQEIETAKSEAERILAEAKAEAEKIKAESKVVSETKKK